MTNVRTTIQAKLVRSALQVLGPAFLVVTLVVVVLNVAISRHNQSQTINRIQSALIAKGRILVSNNAQALTGMVEDNGFSAVQELVAHTVQDDPDVVYGIFMDAQKMPWVMADETTNPDGTVSERKQLADSMAIWASTQKTPERKIVRYHNQEVYEFASPVGGADAPLGYIRYGLSTEAMRITIEAERKASLWILLQVVVVLLALGGTALWASFRALRGQAQKLSHPVRELAAAAEIISGGDYKKTVTVESDDEIGDLAASFESMRRTVQTYTEHLEDLIAEKMRQVRDILDNVEQGLFVLNFDGTIAPEYSKAATIMLGVEKLTTISEGLHLSPAQESDFRGWLRIVRDKHATMRWEKLIKLAPVQELELPGEGDSRFIRIRYQRMYDKNRNVDKIMVLAQDETEQRRIERIVSDEKDRHENEVRTILGLINNLPEVIHDFLKDTSKRLQDLEECADHMLKLSSKAREDFPDGPPFHPTHEQLSRLFRDLHTIKGNSGTYGFETMARLAHQGEDLLEELKEPLRNRSSLTLAALLEKIHAMGRAYEEVLATQKRLSGGGKEGDSLVQIAERKIEHLRKLARALETGVRQGVEPEGLRPLLDACDHLRDIPLAKLAEKYRSLMERLAEKLGKSLIFEATPGHMELDPHFFGPVDEALMHLLRNAVDHGVEDPEARSAAGKEIKGRIALDVIPTEDSVTLRVRDDGGGIDVDRVAAKAVETGLIDPRSLSKMTDQDKINLIFEAGLSTATSVSDVSGRGVGMNAVRECIETLGGTITIRTRKGIGTEYEMVLPVKFGRR